MLEIIQVFGKLGILSFGGPNAHLAMMEREVVEKRNWLTRDRFLDLIGLTNLIPGPNSTEMAIHVGYLRGGRWGLILAGVSFILPAALISVAFAWMYVKFGSLPQYGWFLAGVKPATVAIVLDALWRLGKKALKTGKLATIAVIVSLLAWGGVNETLALLIGGVGGMFWCRWGDGNGGSCSQSDNSGENPESHSPNRQKNNLISFLSLASIGSTVAAVLPTIAIAETTTKATISLWQLGWFFLKTGSLLFGGGYVLFAFIRGELVDGLHWLTERQLLDAIAIGQMTPGPILSTATFIGYLIAGLPGAIVATIGIFLPAFIFVYILSSISHKIDRYPWLRTFLDSVNASSIALMAVLTIQLTIATIGKPALPFIQPISTAILIFSYLAIAKFKIDPAWIVLAGGTIGGLTIAFFGF
jgi:chromate transporter